MGDSSRMYPAGSQALDAPQQAGCLEAAQEQNAVGHQPATSILQAPQAATALPAAQGSVHAASGACSS